MLNIDLKKVLEEFGKTLGLELAFDADGVCVLALEEEMPIIIRALEENSSLTLSCAFRDELPQSLTLAQVEDLLALALDPMERGGASPVVGREAESGLLAMYMVLPPSLLDKTPLAEVFGYFVTTLKSVAAMLDESGEAPSQLGDQFSRMWV